MDIMEAIYAELVANADLARLVGGKIFPVEAPQDTRRPFVVYQRVYEAPIHYMVGDLPLGNPRVSFTCWADTVGGANGVADQVMATFPRAKGSLAGGTTTGVAAFLESRAEISDTEARCFGVVVDFTIWYNK